MTKTCESCTHHKENQCRRFPPVFISEMRPSPYDGSLTIDSSWGYPYVVDSNPKCGEHSVKERFNAPL